MAIDLSTRASESKRTVGRSVSVNGVHAIDVELNKTENLNSPLVDLNIKVNNPVGRLWLALKRLWKSQNTIIALRFTIPLIVLPIALYIGYRLWQGRGLSTPMSKLGIIHQVVVAGNPQDILVLPTSDVYLLSYSLGFDPSSKVLEKPVIVIGSYNHTSNQLSVESLIAYNPTDIPQSTTLPRPLSMWETITAFIAQFR